MKLFLLNVGEILIDEKYKPIALTGTWALSGGYVHGSSGKYRGQYLHVIIAELAGLNIINKIDHKDGNSLNNQLSNLRSATHAQNMQNHKIYSNNTSSVTGVYYHKVNKNWYVRVNEINLGSFRTFEEASEVREEAALKYHGEFAR